MGILGTCASAFIVVAEDRSWGVVGQFPINHAKTLNPHTLLPKP